MNLYIKRKTKYFTNSEILFLTSFGLFLIVMIIKQSFLANLLGLNSYILYKCIIFVCLMILCLKEYIKTEYHYIWLIHIFVMGLLALLIKNVSAFTVSISLVFIFCSRDVEFRKIAVVAKIVTIIVVSVIIFLSLVGVIENYHMDINSERERAFLGFTYALFAPAFFMNVVLLDLYLKNRGIKLIRLMVYFFINQWLFVQTNSRLSYYITIVLLAFGLILRIGFPSCCFDEKKIMLKNGLLVNTAKACIIFSFVLCAIFSLYIHANYNPQIAIENKLNDLLTGRLYYGQKSIQEYGFSLFGEKIEWVGNGLDLEGNKDDGEYLYVDNVYIQFAQHYGVLFFALVICLLTFSMRKLVIAKEWMLIFVFLVIAAYAIINDTVLHLWYNTFWLAVSPYLFSETILRRHWKNAEYLN